MSNCFEEAQAALLSIHEFQAKDEGAPLETTFQKLRLSVLEPDPTASAHAGLRQSIESLLYNSSNPPDLIQWLAATDLFDEKEITAGRKQAFDLLTDHLVRYFDEAKKHTHGILTQIMKTFRYERGSDGPRISALRCLRKVMRRLPSELSLTHSEECGRVEPQGDTRLISVQSVWDLLLSELRFGHPTRKTKSLSMIEALLKTLGLVAECYHDIESTWWGPEIAKLVQIATGNLKKNFDEAKSAKPDMAVVAGSFACLERCWRFTDIDEGSLWRYCRISIGSFTTQDGSKLHRYEVPSKALRFLSRHAEKLVTPSMILSGDLVIALPKIRMCALAFAAKVKTPGRDAYESCFAALAYCTFEAQGAENGSRLTKITEGVITELSDSLEDSTQTSNEVLVTLEAIAAFLATNGVNVISTSLKDKILSQLWLVYDRPVTNDNAVLVDAYGGEYLAQEKASGWESSSYPLKILSACLRAACSIFTQSLTSNVEGELTRLDRMVERCFIEYPFAGPATRDLVIKALSFVFMELGSNAVSFILASAGREGIRRATARETSVRPQALPHFDEIGEPDPRLCWAHSLLWSRLLNADQKNGRGVMTACDMLIEKRRSANEGGKNKEIGGMLLGFLLEECVSYINKLDLSYTPEHSGIVSKNPYNHDILLNLVTFLEATLPTVSSHYFKPWASVLFHGIIARSKELPDVSAFYRLMKLALALSLESGLLGENDDEQVQEPVRAYLAFVSVAAGRFSDELLCSALRLLLCPASLSISNPSASLPSLKLALGKATSHIPTAEVAVSALEHWHVVDMLSLRSHLKELLPLLQPLLFDAIKRGEKASDAGEKIVGVESTTQLASLQRRIVVFLGRLGGEGKKLVVPADDALRSVLRWEELPPDTLPLFVSFPLSRSQFGELSLQLPELLPRITDLCTGQGGDRQTRALAAECLHASILFLVGSAATDASGGAARRYIKLWKRMFHVVPQLAVDSEASTRLLFSKLLKQLIHWFSNSSAKEEEATALLNSLSEGIASEDNHALREICASSMAEFSRYAIKQASSKTISQSPIAADRLIGRLKNMATHTDHKKRSGAVLAFSHMYKEFREEKSLVSRHALSLCHSFFISLRRSQADHVALEGSRYATNAVKDAANIIFKSVRQYGDPSRLLKPNSDRGFPSSLGDLVGWLWDNIGSSEVAFHIQCTGWFYAFAPLLSVSSSTSGASSSQGQDIKSSGCRAWIEAKGNLKEMCVQCFEASLYDNVSIASTMFGLLSSLDAYIWALNKNIVSVEDVFSGSGGCVSPIKANSKKKTAPSVSMGIMSCLTQFAASTLELMEGDKNYFDEWGELRVKIIRRTCDLLSILAPYSTGVRAVMKAGLWDRPLHTLLLKCLLALPSSSSVIPTSSDDCVELQLYFPSSLERLLVNYEKYDNQSHGLTLKESVTSDWISQYWKVGNLKLGHPDTTNILRAFRLLLKYNLCDKVNDLTPLTSNLKSISELQEPLDPMARYDGAAFLQTALDLGWPVLNGSDSLVGVLLDTDIVEISGKSVTKGSLFHSRLRGDIDNVLLGIGVYESVVSHLLNTESDAAITCYEQLADHMTKKCIATHLVSIQDFLGASKPHLHSLRSLLDSNSGLDQLLRITEMLLRLDARLPLNERLGVRSETLLRMGVVRALELGGDINGSIVLKLSALRLIPFFIPGVSQSAPLKIEESAPSATDHKELLAAVEVMASNHFPLRSNEQAKNCALESNYITLLSEVVKVSSSAGTLLLFSKILPQLKEGDSHRYASLLHKGLKALAMKVDVSNSACMFAALSWVLKIVLSEREPSTTRRMLFEMLLIPLLRRAPPDRLLDIATQNGLLPFGRIDAEPDKCLIENILDLLLIKADVRSNAVFDFYFKRQVAMEILEQIYDGLSETALDKNISKNPKFDKDQKLNGKLCRYLHGAYSDTELDDYQGEDKRAILQFKAAAYSCLCIVIMATQKKEKMFVNFLWQFKAGKVEGKLPWSSVIDLEHEYNFKLFLPRAELKRRSIWPNAFRLPNIPSSTPALANKRPAFNPSYMGDSFSLSQSDVSSMLEPNMAANLISSQLPVDEHGTDFGDESIEQDSEGASSSSLLSQSSQDITTLPEPEINRREVRATDMRDRLGYATLEMSDLNREPCMSTLVRSIIKYHEVFLAGDNETEAQEEAVPPWLPEVIKMLDSSQHRNVRLFGLKLLLNDDIRPLCRAWIKIMFAPIMTVAVEELNKTSEGFHTLLQDLCFCLNNPNLWECEAFDDDLCARFISHLLAVSFVPSSTQLKQNVADISSLLMRWRPRNLDLGPVADLLATEFKGSGGAKGRAAASTQGDTSGTHSWMKRRLGLQLVSALFGAEYPCLSAICPDSSRIAKGLADSCGFGRKEVYTTAAAVCGEALLTLEGMAISPCSEAMSLQNNILSVLKPLTSAKQLPQLVIVVAKITTVFPAFMSRELCIRLLNHFPHLKSKERMHVLACFNDMHDKYQVPLFDHLRAYLPSLLTDSTKFNVGGGANTARWIPQVQIATVRLLMDIALDCDANGMRVVLAPGQPHGIIACSNSPCRELRSYAFELLCKLYTSHPLLNGRKEGAEDLRNATRCALLKGLADPDEDLDDTSYTQSEGNDDDEGDKSAMGYKEREPVSIRKMMFSYWSDTATYKGVKENGIIGVMERLLNELWDPSIAEHWVHFATYLLLDQSTISPSYNTKLYRISLGECVFRTLKVDSGSMMKGSAMVPRLSLESQIMQSQSQDSSFVMPPILTDDDNTQLAPGFIKATMDKQWTMTQQGNAMDIYGEETQDTSSTGKSPVQTGSFTIGKTSMPAPSRRRVSATSRFYSSQVEAQRRRTMSSQASSSARKRKVSLLRSYRDGELPDIQAVSVSEIVRPLQALILKDAPLARILFSWLFTEVFQYQAESAGAQKAITVVLEKMLKDASLQTDLVGCLLASARRIVSHPHLRESEFRLDAVVVADASLRSLNYHSGILLLEEILLLRMSSVAHLEQEYDEANEGEWLQLSRLYAALNEKDVLVGLSKRSAKHEETREALKFEQMGNFNKAIGVYNKLISRQAQYENSMDDADDWDPATEAESTTWEQRSVNCCRQLGQWVDVKNVLVNSERTVDQLWSDTYKDWALPHYVRSLVAEPQHHPELKEFLETNFKVDSRRKWLEERLTCEVSMAAALDRDWSRLNYYATLGFRHFLSSWSGLHPCATAARKLALGDLQRLVELEDLSDCASASLAGSVDLTTKVKNLLVIWDRQQPDSQDSPSVWSDLATDRTIGLGSLLDYLTPVINNKVQIIDLKRLLDKHLASVHFSAATASVQHGHKQAAKLHIQQATDLISSHADDSDPTLRMARMRAVCAYNFPSPDHKRSKRMVSIEKSRIHIQEAALDLINAKDEIKQEVALYQGNWAEMHYDILKEEGEGGNDSALLVSSVSDAMEAFNNCGDNADAHVAMASLCDKLILNWEEKASSDHLSKRSKGSGVDGPFPHQPEVSAAEVACIIITHTFEALKCGGSGAHKASFTIPRLLQLLRRHPACVPTFKQVCHSVPTWPFLRWTSQLCALLDRDVEGDAVTPLLERMAKDYPQALRYPYQISLESLSQPTGKLNDNQRIEGMKARTGTLSRLVEDDTAEDFVESLKGLQHPEFWLKDALWAIMKKLAEKGSDPQFTVDWIKATYFNVYNILFVDSDREVGSVLKQFRRKPWQRELDAVFGKKGEKVVFGSKPFKEGVSKLVNAVRKDMNIKAGKGALASFSPYLASYDGSTTSDRALEVPGQYWCPSVRPDPATHARIASFDNEVLTMSSLRKPKRLTVLGDDEKERSFLVKGGEDLRNDERIEQLLTLMNGILLKDGPCAGAGLTVRTYSVIPLTTDIGLLEWVPNTVPIRGFLTEGIEKMAQASKSSKKRSSEKPITSPFSMGAQYLKMTCHAGNNNPDYHDNFKNVPASKVVPGFQNLVKTVPWDLLRRQLMSMASEPEVFLTCRNEFARSFAVWSMACYVLGIGDRHLDNFLIDKHSGQIVPIDFGMAFGMGASELPVPEFIPFRLTPQFTNLLRPLDSVGLLSHHCALAMKAFRVEASVLVRTMDVFLQDPIVDWVQSCSKKREEVGEEDYGQGIHSKKTKDTVVWEPQRRIRNAERKLHGFNPMDILIDDISKNNMCTKYNSHSALNGIIRGQEAGKYIPERVKSAALQEEILSISDQVTCLIDMATDPNILGRQYQGLATWV